MDDKEIIKLVEKQLKKFNINIKPSGFTYYFNPNSFLPIIHRNMNNLITPINPLKLKSYVTIIIRSHIAGLIRKYVI